MKIKYFVFLFFTIFLLSCSLQRTLPKKQEFLNSFTINDTLNASSLKHVLYGFFLLHEQKYKKALSYFRLAHVYDRDSVFLYQKQNDLLNILEQNKQKN